ncbi:unnamed protein product [Mytilus coruscus]|uniref:MAM domain-containing protein n=1 Tax=Mytilus coruscus TaxID=42192 RepID=A0A6J8C392_MYTCO|nr:unnamed protein product [Mytilus coruscus]
METIYLDVQQNGNMIAFIGIIRHYESCTIALDDVSITPGSCSGIETHTHRCTDLNNIMDIETCPKFYLEKCSFGKRNKEIVNNTKRNDYIGQQQIALPQSSNSVSHVQYTYPESESSNKDHGNGNSGIPFQNNNCQYYYNNITATNSRVNEEKTNNELTDVALQKDMPRGKYVSNDDEYAIVDPKAKTSVYHSKEDKIKATENYVVLDPNETGFDRSHFPDKNQPYELAKPVSDKYTDAEYDRYAVSPEGTYDFSGSNRRNELEDNIYNHAVDDVYDSGSYMRTNEGKDDTYDYFFGQKTEDLSWFMKWYLFCTIELSV